MSGYKYLVTKDNFGIQWENEISKENIITVMCYDKSIVKAVQIQYNKRQFSII